MEGFSKEVDSRQHPHGRVSKLHQPEEDTLVLGGDNALLLPGEKWSQLVLF